MLKRVNIQYSIDLEDLPNEIKEKYNISHFGEQSVNMLSGHPTDKAHTEWGEYLTKYIKDNYELN